MNGQRQVNCVGPYLSWDGVLFQRCLWRFGERAMGTLTSFQNKAVLPQFWLLPNSGYPCCPGTFQRVWPTSSSNQDSFYSSFTPPLPPTPSSTNQLQLMSPAVESCLRSFFVEGMDAVSCPRASETGVSTSCTPCAAATCLWECPLTSWSRLGHRKVDKQSSHVESMVVFGTGQPLPSSGPGSQVFSHSRGLIWPH